MPSTTQYSVLLIALLLAGCTEGFGGIGNPQSPNTPVENEPTHTAVENPSGSNTAGVAEPIVVVNNRSSPYQVRLYVMSESNPELTVTLGNGSTATKSVNESSPLVQGVPFIHRSSSSIERIRNISSIQPRNSEIVAEWSGIVQPNSAVTLPRPFEQGSITILIVIKTTITEDSVVYTAAMEQCNQPRSDLSKFRISLQENGDSLRISSSCP